MPVLIHFYDKPALYRYSSILHRYVYTHIYTYLCTYIYFPEGMFTYFCVVQQGNNTELKTIVLKCSETSELRIQIIWSQSMSIINIPRIMCQIYPNFNFILLDLAKTRTSQPTRGCGSPTTLKMQLLHPQHRNCPSNPFIVSQSYVFSTAPRRCSSCGLLYWQCHQKVQTVAFAIRPLRWSPKCHWKSLWFLRGKTNAKFPVPHSAAFGSYRYFSLKEAYSHSDNIAFSTAFPFLTVLQCASLIILMWLSLSLSLMAASRTIHHWGLPPQSNLRLRNL